MSLASPMVKPARKELLRVEVVRSAQLSSTFRRVTLGGPGLAAFTPMGYDQWFRFFVPTGDPRGLDTLPPRADTTAGYIRYLRIKDDIRPLYRNYTVRAFRPESLEMDVDFVLHGDAQFSASTWARTCGPGDPAALIDEGIGFDPARGTQRVLLVGDETAVPAVSGILASLPEHATGVAICEVPGRDDVLDLAGPDGVEIRWFVREAGAVPGRTALAAVRDVEITPDTHVFSAGESALATGVRRDVVGRGHAKDRVSFCGYWKI